MTVGVAGKHITKTNVAKGKWVWPESTSQRPTWKQDSGCGRKAYHKDQHGNRTVVVAEKHITKTNMVKNSGCGQKAHHKDQHRNRTVVVAEKHITKTNMVKNSGVARKHISKTNMETGQWVWPESTSQIPTW